MMAHKKMAVMMQCSPIAKHAGEHGGIAIQKYSLQKFTTHLQVEWRRKESALRGSSAQYRQTDVGQ